MWEVLLVEDNPDDVELILREVRRHADFNVSVAVSGEKCLEKLKERTYDVVLLDYMLPEMDGLEVLEKIIESGYDLPVVVVTGRGDEEVATSFLKKGAYDYVVKSPGYLPKLPVVVKSAIERYEMEKKKRELEEEILKQKNELESIFASMGEALLIVDKDMKILSANKMAEMWFGKDVTNRHCFQLYGERKNICPECATVNVFKTGEVVKNEQCFFERSGRRMQTVVTTTPLKDESGNIIAAVKVISDVTKLKELEQELMNKNKELEGFLYTVSHDLKIPLRGMEGFSRAMLEDCGEMLDKTCQHYLHRIIENTRNMNTLIEDLLLYSRVGKLTTSYEEVDISEVVKKVIESVQHQLEEKNIELVVHKLPIAYCSERGITEVFANLMSNAIRFSKKENPRIEIGCDDKESEYQFFVKDNGIGFDMKDHDKIFKLFEQLQKEDEYKGTGIGLAIVKKIVEAHYGKVWAKSSVGKGSTFYFALPKGGK